MTAKNLSPWTDYPKAPTKDWDHKWDTDNYPYVVRWSVPAPYPTRWRSYTREFATLEEAVAAFKRPFRGLDIDLVAYNGRAPGQHLDTLAKRKCTKPTKWADAVPAELRA